MKEKLIESILENFDFEEVRKVMNFLNWTWHNEDETPSTYKLINSAKRRLEEVYEISMREDRNCSISSGGLKASTIWDEGQVVFLELEFVLTSWDESIDDE